MLNITDKLDYDVIKKIFKRGFSRIPVYETEKRNVASSLSANVLLVIPVTFISMFSRMSRRSI